MVNLHIGLVHINDKTLQLMLHMKIDGLCFFMICSKHERLRIQVEYTLSYF
jgi:hypothetical protein